MTYIDEGKMKVTNKTAKTQLIWGIILVVLGVSGFSADLGPDETMVEMWIASLMALVPGILLIYLSIKNKRRVELVRKLNQQFSVDQDGVIPASSLMRMLGTKTEDRAVKTLDSLIGKGYIAGCTVSYDQGARVILTRRGENVVDFKTIVCPDCGAKTEVRVGFTNRCQHCGRIIDAKSVDDKQ